MKAEREGERERDTGGRQAERLRERSREWEGRGERAVVANILYYEDEPLCVFLFVFFSIERKIKTGLQNVGVNHPLYSGRLFHQTSYFLYVVCFV